MPGLGQVSSLRQSSLRQGSLSQGVLALALIAAFAVASAPQSHAQSAESFYRGKNLTFIVPDGVGGGYDAYARLLARHLADHIPGHPRIVTQNMPGAAGLIATNWLFHVAPRDGSVMGETYSTALTEPLLGDAAAQYDPTQFAWIGSMTRQYNVCMVWHTSPVATISDAESREVRVSTTGLAGNSTKLPLMLNMLLGTKFKIIAGYTSGGMRLAVERGEVEGICGVPYDTYQAANPEWLTDNKIRFILQTGSKPMKALPDVPLLFSYVKDPKQRAALEVIAIDQDAGRPQLFPPGVPDYLVKALRTAFDDTMKDPKFLADAATMNVHPEPMTGAAIADELKQAYAAPKDIVALAAKLWPPALSK
jgi:tripartite-type tricarboxylate transporter receptor subunit TctC